jgi:N utilization substance protein A
MPSQSIPAQDFMSALLALSSEKGLPREVVVDAVEEALAVSYRRRYGTVPAVRVSVDPQTGQMRVLGRKTVVVNVRDERTQISLKEAQETQDPGGLDEEVEVDITPADFARIGAQSAKHAILQRIHEAERDLLYREFAGKEGELLAGIIQRIDGSGVVVDMGKSEGVIPPAEQIPTERYRVGQRLKLYCVEVNRGGKSPTVVLSRTHKGLLKRLFEQEVPEVLAGTVEIRSIAREPGSRSKIAVMSTHEGTDPVGACVGIRGGRIQAVVNELGSERVDIIQFSDDPALFVAHALSPANVESVELDTANKRAIVTVSDAALSLAIGREGQNARLAAKLTGWRIDIHGSTSAGGAISGYQESQLEPHV